MRELSSPSTWVETLAPMAATPTRPVTRIPISSMDTDISMRLAPEVPDPVRATS